MKNKYIILGGAILFSASMLVSLGYFYLYDSRVELEEVDFSDRMSFISSVDSVSWSWDPPESMHVSGAHPIAAGLLVIHRHGLVALHGETSEEIWSYELEENFSVSVAADGLGVLVLAGGNPGSRPIENIVFLDAITGDSVSEYPAPEGVFLHSSLMTAGQLLVPSDGGLSAYGMRTGDLSWKYEGRSECLALPDFNPGEPWIWPASTSADDLFIPEICPIEKSDGAGVHEGAFSISIIAIDGGSGGTLWESEPVPMYVDDASDEAFPPVWVSVTDDARAVRMDASGENYMFDSATGDLLEGNWPLAGDDGFYNDLRVYIGSSWNIWYQREGSGPGYHDYVKTSYSGKVVQEVQVPEESHVLVDHLWEPVNRALALEDGILTYGCTTECGDPSTGHLKLIFAPWNDDPLEIEVEQLDPEINNAHVKSRLLAVPGAVVAYQENQSGQVLGSFVGIM